MPSTPAANVVVVIAGGAVTVIVSTADFFGSVTEVAVTVAVPVPLAAAVYVTEVAALFDSAPGPLNVQVTPAFLASLIVTVMVTLWPLSTACEEEARVTVTVLDSLQPETRATTSDKKTKILFIG